MAVEPAELYPQQSPHLRLVEPTIPAGDDIPGYTFVPRSEENSYDLARLAQLPTAYLRGLGQAASHLLHHYNLGDTSDAQWPYPEEREYNADGNVIEARITEANPELGVPPDKVTTQIIILGLGEIPGVGSSHLWHMDNAVGHPDRRIVTLSTPGMGRHTLPMRDGYNRLLEETAAEDFEVVREIAGDSPVNIVSDSLSTKRAFMLAAINLAARGESQIDIRRMKALAPAMGARNVAEEERFTEVSADDPEFIQGETNKFYRHMPGNILHELLARPEAIGACMAIVGAYALSPHKLPFRAATLAGNVRSAQEGVDWEIIKEVARGHRLHVVAGADDPLAQAQKAQMQAVIKHAPGTQVRMLEGYGHVLTTDGPAMMEHLIQMELADTA